MEIRRHENIEKHNIDEAEALIERLRTYDEVAFPFADAKRALELKTEITPLLLRELKKAALDLKGSLDRDEWFLTMFSIYTLSYFRETSALEPILAICKQPIEYTDELLGDCITESLHRILASTYNGDFESFKPIILDAQLDEFVRASVFRTFIVLYHWKNITREELANFVSQILENTKEDDTSMILELEDACYILKDEQLLAKLTEIIDPAELDVSFSGNMEIRAEFSIEYQKRINYVEKASHFKHLSDPIVEMSSWHGFKEEKPKDKGTFKRKLMPKDKESEFDFDLAPIPPLERTLPKLGRNDPCYCLSGKKYKKCCLPLQTEKEAAALKEDTLQQQYVKEVERHISRGYDAYPYFSLVCEHLLKAWDLLKVKIDPLIPSLEYIRRVYRFEVDLNEFLHKLEFAFLQAAMIHRSDAEKGLIFFREVLSYGVDNFGGSARYLKSKMAIVGHFAGEEEEAESIAQSIIEEWPHYMEGYTVMAELTKLRSAPLSEALTWYEKALEYADSDAHKDEIADIIENLKKEILQLEERTI
ncbi:MAG: DUF1186 domain-containing protein [Pseudomonadota bacterium]